MIYRVTKFVAIDCEFDQGLHKNIPCRITIVNDKGELIIDSLVHHNFEFERSNFQIHGIQKEDMHDAPTRERIAHWVEPMI